MIQKGIHVSIMEIRPIEKNQNSYRQSQIEAEIIGLRIEEKNEKERAEERQGSRCDGEPHSCGQHG